MKKLILCLALAGFLGAASNISSAMPLKLYSNYSPADTSEYQKFKIEAKQQIQNNENSIARFRDKMSTKTGEAKASLKVKVDSLEAKNRRLDNELSQYTKDAKSDAKNDWRTFKQKFNTEMDKLKKSFDDVKNDMK